jgi:hypothetical protein
MLEIAYSYDRNNPNSNDTQIERGEMIFAYSFAYECYLL